MAQNNIRNTSNLERALNRTITRRTCLKSLGALVVYAAVDAYLPQGVGTVEADAATPIRKGYVTSLGHVTVYKDTNCSTKLGTIYGDEDEIIINSISSDNKVLNVTYYITGSSKTKSGYIPVSALLPTTETTRTTSKAKVTTYKWSTGSSTYGYVDVGDSIVLYIGSDKNISCNGRYRLLYPAASNYKFAWVDQAGLNALLGESQSSSFTTLSSALYKNSSARITCGYDGYTTTKGRHEGIDITLSNDSPVYSLVAGEVINVITGSNGSSGLSQIAIYDGNNTVLYLHSNPIVKKGQTVAVGQQIATQGWRGCSSASGGHTHVEVRDGRRTRAAKSVNDNTLENPDPTSFWQNHGYSIG
jgi:murein DD-endopeptidase MepM/ murein hydrolase activator NlpD